MTRLLLAVVILAGAGCNRPENVSAPVIAVVSTQHAESLDSAGVNGASPEYIGTVRASSETDFSFKIGGIIELIGPTPERDWDEGSRVKAGTVLARLQQEEFNNALASAKASADFAVSNNERLARLLSDKVVSKQEVDKAKTDVETAAAQLRQARQNLRDSELRAPWDGLVFRRYVNAGETVSGGKQVLRFGDNRSMSVEVGVPDRLVGFFSVGKEIDVDISALPGRPPFRGTTSEVGVAATDAGRLYRVVIKVPNPDGVIKSGMTATVKASMVAASTSGQVVVPLSALISPSSASPNEKKAPSQLAVFVVAGGKASQRLIQTSDIIASSIIVTDGLKANEEVVTKGASLLYDGAPVEVR